MSDQSASHDEREVFHGDLLTVRVQTVTSPGGAPQRYEIVEHPDAVAIVALRNDPTGGEPQVALVRQSRPAVERETWELPAGLVRAEERDAPQRTAERELREETGAIARTWRQLAREYPSPGFSTEAITIFLATEVELVGPMGADPDILDVQWLPLSQALERARAGEIEDGKTLLGLTLAASGGAAMLADPTNMPFPRPESSTPSRDSSRGGGAPDGQLHLEAMLMAEFNYISVTAYQAMEDRARMFNLYLLLIGVLASGLGVVNQLGGGSRAYTPWLSFGLLFLAAVLGVVFFFKLIRLRQAHRDSLIAMNLIKALYIRLFSNQYQHLQNVFHWRLDTIPGGERVGSVTFLVCFTVAFLDSLCFGAAAFFGYTLFLAPGGLATLKPETIGMPLLVAAGTAAVVAIVQVVYYLSAFSKRREKKRLLKVEERIAQVRLVTEA